MIAREPQSPCRTLFLFSLSLVPRLPPLRLRRSLGLAGLPSCFPY